MGFQRKKHSPDFFLEELLRRYPQLSQCRDAIAESYGILAACFENSGKVLICGNGGSAADAGHMSAELLKAFCRPRILNECWQVKLSPALYNALQGSLPAIPLPDFVAIQTAFGNDCSPEFCFAQLVFGLGNVGDVLFSISTSGNSKNILAANEVARAKGMKVIGLTSRSGGQMKTQCDICIGVPEEETFKIQELHLPLYHALCLMLEARFF